MPDPEPDIRNGLSNGLSNDDIERRTWDWFAAAVGLLFGPAYYQRLTPPDGDHWPDVLVLRAHDRVGFEITSPLRPEDVVKKSNRNGDEDDGELTAQAKLERRVIEAVRRKIKKYGSKPTDFPLGLLVTLAHPSSLKFSSSATDLLHLSQVVKSRLGHLIHQPIDAVYLVGPGERAYLLWRRRGAKWKKLFPELHAATQRTELSELG
ncbi:hypothetical protein EHM69_04985 [candidate division KSB1 bacterium]|nr:MAG: hypothetical protein EHM69_04985 [candidate division KSB1 bacterium]